MSLGSRINYRRSRLIPLNFSTTPRDSLWFLYPRWFTSQNSQAPEIPRTLAAQHSERLEASSLSNPSTGETSNSDKDLRVHWKSASSHPLPSTNNKTPTNYFENAVRQGLPEQKAFQLGPTLSNDREFVGFKSFDEALLGVAKQKLKHGFKLQETQIKRFASYDKKRESDLETKRARSTDLIAKDEWSWDWRVPLMDLKLHYEDDTKSAIPTTFIRPYFDGQPPRYLQIRAQDIPCPEIWSSLTFAAYVEDLTQSKVTRPMQQILYGGEDTHQEAIQDLLMSLFEDVSLRCFVTVLAFDTAMIFLYRHRMIPSARILFQIMGDLRLELPTESFNIMLRSTAHLKDLHNFTYILRLMIERGIKPNGDSWIAFLGASKSKAVKLKVASVMRSLGILNDPCSLKGTVRQLLDEEVDNFTHHGEDLASFLEYLELKYSTQWISYASGQRLVYKLAGKGRMAEAISVLDLMHSHDCTPQASVLKVLLNLSQPLDDIGHIIPLLRLFELQFYVRASDETCLEELFKLSWRLHNLNACKVVWRTACLRSAVSYEMQRRVLESLYRNTPTDTPTAEDIWMKLVGKVLIGVEHAAHGPLTRDHPHWEALESSTDYATPGTERVAQLCRVKNMLGRDLDASLHYRLYEDFLQLFERAVALDEVWRSDATMERESVMWMVQNAIEVKVLPWESVTVVRRAATTMTAATMVYRYVFID